MKVFGFYKVEEAVNYAKEGGQSLHLHCIVFDNSPRCFRDAVRVKKEPIAHLYDQDKERLVATAKKLGVRIIFIDHEDAHDQHIDLCGSPLRNLIRGHLDAMLRKGKSKKAASLVEYLLVNFSGTHRWNLT